MTERQYRLPRNVVWEPTGKRGTPGQGRLVLVRLEFGSRVRVVPAELLWLEVSAAHVQWVWRGHQYREWFARRDVAWSMDW